MAEAPVAAAPAPASAAAPAPAAAAPAPATAAPAAATPPNVIAEAKATPPAAEAPPALDAVKAFLTEKGAKAEELAALDETALRAKYDEAKKITEAKPAEVKPEDFAVKAPEGVEVDSEILGKLQATLADAKLTPAERAQALFDLHQAQITKQAEGLTNLWMKTQTDWTAAWKADPEIGGANLDTVTSTIAKALDAIGGKEAQKMREAFIFTGAGNNPEIGRLIFRMSKALVESGAITGEPAATAKSGDAATESALMALYPTASKAR